MPVAVWYSTVEARRNEMNRYKIENRKTGEVKTVHALGSWWACKSTGWKWVDCRIVEWERVG
jgi:hypothetical protein